MPGYDAGLWRGFVGPTRVPPETVRRLNSAIVAVLGVPDVRARRASQGVDSQPTTPEEFSRLLASDVSRWARVIQRAGIRPG